MFRIQRQNQSNVMAIQTQKTPGRGLPIRLFTKTRRYAQPILAIHMVVMEENIRYFTSPLALKTAVRVHALGHIIMQQTEW